MWVYSCKVKIGLLLHIEFFQILYNWIPQKIIFPWRNSIEWKVSESACVSFSFSATLENAPPSVWRCWGSTETAPSDIAFSRGVAVGAFGTHLVSVSRSVFRGQTWFFCPSQRLHPEPLGIFPGFLLEAREQGVASSYFVKIAISSHLLMVDRCGSFGKLWWNPCEVCFGNSNKKKRWGPPWQVSDWCFSLRKGIHSHQVD